MTAENLYLAKAKMEDVIDIMQDGDYWDQIPDSRVRVIVLLRLAVEQLPEVKKDHGL